MNSPMVSALVEESARPGAFFVCVENFEGIP